MPRKPCYWTRKLELDLIEFVREREFIWKPFGNTNHQIQQKYKAYAEFAARLGRGFSARSVRDRWVNIRSTFNHNLRRVDKSKETAKSPAEVHEPCWPLWKPLQFLREKPKKENVHHHIQPCQSMQTDEKVGDAHVSFVTHSEIDNLQLGIRQRGVRTDRPRRRTKSPSRPKRTKRADKCVGFVEDLVMAMRPIVPTVDVDTSENARGEGFWFFGKHVTERLNAMRDIDASSASRDILALLDRCGRLDDIAVKGEQFASD